MLRDRRDRRRVRRDRGAADALGLVILVVPMLAFALLVFYLGRNVDARAQVRSAAESAAQAAALERNDELGRSAAQATVSAMLDADVCPTPDVNVEFSAADFGGTADRLVEVLIRCDVSNADVAALDVAATDRIEARAFATVDRFRANG